MPPLLWRTHSSLGRKSTLRIQLISHSLDFSGAPIALLRLAQALIRLGHTVSLAALADGPMRRAFESAGCKIGPNPHDMIIANSVISVPISLELASPTAVTIAWVHEAMYFFDVIGRQPDEFGLSQLHCAWFPSQFQIDEFRPLMPRTELSLQRNHVVTAARKEELPPAQHYVVSGQWEQRKNQEWLLRHAPDYARFLFIGANRPPEHQSVPHSFAGAITPIDAQAKIAQSGGVVCASLSETQNLVAIEALQLGKSVLLNNIPAHVELAGLIPHIILYEHMSPEALRAGFCKLEQQAIDMEAAEESRTAALVEFGRERFERALLSNLKSLA